MVVAVEAKATAKVTAAHVKGLRHVHQEHPRARRVVVCLEPRRRRTDDGIEILPVKAFVEELPELLRART
jgi:hypothetical protein